MSSTRSKTANTKETAPNQPDMAEEDLEIQAAALITPEMAKQMNKLIIQSERVVVPIQDLLVQGDEHHNIRGRSLNLQGVEMLKTSMRKVGFWSFLSNIIVSTRMVENKKYYLVREGNHRVRAVRELVEESAGAPESERFEPPPMWCVVVQPSQLDDIGVTDFMFSYQANKFQEHRVLESAKDQVELFDEIVHSWESKNPTRGSWRDANRSDIYEDFVKSGLNANSPLGQYQHWRIQYTVFHASCEDALDFFKALPTMAAKKLADPDVVKSLQLSVIYQAGKTDLPGQQTVNAWFGENPDLQLPMLRRVVKMRLENLRTQGKKLPMHKCLRNAVFWVAKAKVILKYPRDSPFSFFNHKTQIQVDTFMRMIGKTQTGELTDAEHNLIEELMTDPKYDRKLKQCSGNSLIPSLQCIVNNYRKQRNLEAERKRREEAARARAEQNNKSGAEEAEPGEEEENAKEVEQEDAPDYGEDVADVDGESWDAKDTHGDDAGSEEDEEESGGKKRKKRKAAKRKNKNRRRRNKRRRLRNATGGNATHLAPGDSDSPSDGSKEGSEEEEENEDSAVRAERKAKTAARLAAEQVRIKHEGLKLLFGGEEQRSTEFKSIKCYKGTWQENMEKLPEENSVQLCLMDPPYNATKHEWDKITTDQINATARTVYRVLKPGGTFICFCSFDQLHIWKK